MPRRRGLLSGLLLLLYFAASPFAVRAEPSVTVSQAWSRATPPNAKVGAIYLTIEAHDKSGDLLLRAKSPAAEHAELHTHIKDGDVMRMRRVPSVALEKGGKVVFKPGSYHIMLIGLKQPLKDGDELPVTLTFKTAGDITVLARVQPLGAAGPKPHGSHH